ncbi:MAG: glycosyltransferase family 4 protein [Candidatus Cloacimonetes bacterium]|nr:glycosyltransferase family 4 protein [Candidatus Cloacimonadota bacterium]
MKKIKVLHTITRLIVGGAQENTILSAQLLDKEKFDVDVLCGIQTGPEGSLFEFAASRGVEPLIFKNLVREINIFKDIRHFFEMIIFLKKNHYDIIHTHSSKAGIIHRFAAKIMKVPIIIHTVHGWSFHEHMSCWKRKIYIYLERVAATYTNKMITVTELDIKKGLDVDIGSKEKYKNIHSSIEIDRYKEPIRDIKDIKKELNLNPNNIIVGTVARLSEQKSPLDFMCVAKVVCSKYDNIQFLYVGDGELRPIVEEFINDNNLEDKIILTGLRLDVPDMLAVMDIFILTSLWEGLPRVFSQSMAAKLPIIATKVDGAPEAINDGLNGFMTTPGKPMEIVKELEKLINDETLRKKMGNEGLKIAEECFSVESMIRDIEDAYNSLLNNLD